VSLISRYADEVSLCYDSDEAGQKAVRAALSLFSKTGVRTKVIRLRGGKDPDEIIRDHGKEMFAKLLGEADNDIEYRLSLLRDKYIIETADGKVNFLREASRLLSKCDSLERDIYAMKLADELQVSKDAIMQHIALAVKRDQNAKAKARLSEAQKSVQSIEKAIDPQRLKNIKVTKAEDTVILTLLNNPGFYSKLKERLCAGLFFTAVNNRLFSVIASRLENGESVDLSHISQFLTQEEMSAVAKLLANASMISNTMQECEDCLCVLETEKKNRDRQSPSDMSDDSFLALFSSLNNKDGQN
jgi:DNA primase